MVLVYSSGEVWESQLFLVQNCFLSLNNIHDTDHRALSYWTGKDVQELKDNISSDACIGYFKSSKPVILQVDDSKGRLGAVLYQKDSGGKDIPVVCAPMHLTPAETRYANTE